MVAACDAAGVRLSINHQKRASAYNAYAKRLIADGEIGEVFLIPGLRKRGTESRERNNGNGDAPF